MVLTLNFEKNDASTPNFFTYITNFNLNHNDFANSNKEDITITWHDNYERYWLNEIRSNSPKAITTSPLSFQLIQRNIW